MPKLGVNIDHIATLRQARKEEAPDPIIAARICEQAGADSIVAHLREDRRHIQDKDIIKLRKTIRTRFNLEMSIAPEIVKIALRLTPDQATLVPERRQEITTEGGLDVVRHFTKIKEAVLALQRKRIEVSLFIDPIKKQIDKTILTKAKMIEFHTGRYACATTAKAHAKELQNLKAMTSYARELGLTVNAGHGLDYDNTGAVALISGIEELNIGHSIISRAIFVGLEQAVKEMIHIIRGRNL
jgi:pyridoxine 5-phosphate synthase